MRTLILGIWVIALLIGVVEPTFSAEAPRKGQHLAPRGFSVGTSLSLTCNKIAYAYTGNTRQVTLRITVYGETNNLTGNVTVTGPNTNITEQVGPPSYMKDVTVTLPAGPDKFTYIATAERVDGSQMSASVDLYVVKVVSYSVSSPYYIVKNQTSSITVTLNPDYSRRAYNANTASFFVR